MSTIATGAIAGTDDGDNYTDTRVDFTTTKLTPYLTELVTTMYVHKRSTAGVLPPKALPEIDHDTPSGSHGSPPQGFPGHITAVYSDPTTRERTEARWVKAHSEQSMSECRSGDDEVPAVSGWHTVLLVRDWATARSFILVVRGDSFYQGLLSRGASYEHITTPADFGILLQHIKDMVARCRIDKYCIRRDGY